MQVGTIYTPHLMPISPRRGLSDTDRQALPSVARTSKSVLEPLSREQPIPMRRVTRYRTTEPEGRGTDIGPWPVETLETNLDLESRRNSRIPRFQGSQDFFERPKPRSLSGSPCSLSFESLPSRSYIKVRTLRAAPYGMDGSGGFLPGWGW